jgi:hypothetical protein
MSSCDPEQAVVTGSSQEEKIGDNRDSFAAGNRWDVGAVPTADLVEALISFSVAGGSK